MSTITNDYQEFDLADPQFAEPAPVDFLLGADLYPEVITGPCKTIQENIPKLMSTIFGYVVIGKINQNNDSLLTSTFFTTTWGDNLNENLKHFWEIEEVPSSKEKDPDDMKCEEYFQQTFSRTEEGVYVVRLPFKEDLPEFSSSSSIALKRFHSLETKLNKSPQLKSNYVDFMEEYQRLKHMSVSEGNTKFFIPHHCVMNKFKIRVVFDGSVKTAEGSLNDFLLVGEKLQNDSRLILMNFRLHRIAFTCDIVKMFRNILVHKQDRAYQNIYWRSDPSEAIQPFTLNTVTYGLGCSPFLALRVIKQLSIDEGKHFPLAASVLETDIYIDDIATGCDKLETALLLQTQIINLLRRGGFSLSKWSSNSSEILETVNQNKENVQPVSITSEENFQKILGLYWDSINDNFIFKIDNIERIFTKRRILSTVAKLYDPLGFLGPTIFLMKYFIQILWKKGLGWDDCLPLPLRNEWSTIIKDLPLLSKIQLSRYICHSEPFTYQIVGFADASIKGYCAVLYIRVIPLNSPIRVSLLISKTKLAPVKTISVPRLELCGAHLLTKLYNSISSFLTRLPKTEIEPCFFVDSSIVLSWIKTPSYKLKTFVGNRISEICNSVPPHWWKHVDSTDNASDCGSRGLTPIELINHKLWWNGPPWLQLPQEEWPKSSIETINFSDLPEAKKDLTTVLLSTSHTFDYIIEWMQRISSYQRILRTIAWINRFISNCRKRIPPKRGPLQMEELNNAFHICVKGVQQYYFFKNNPDNWSLVNSHLSNLSPFLDQRGILRAGGRLRNSNLSPNHKYPILLPQKCHFTIVLIDFYHKVFLHPGPSLLQALLQTKFWIPCLRRLVKQRIFHCLKCYKLKQRVITPIMGDLPATRFIGTRAFLITGVDFAGPFTIRESLRRKANQFKAYLCVFVCLSTKALHLEIVSSLSTEAFLAAFDRFTSRRGLPQEVISDCGTNFVGAANKMKEFRSWYQDQITQGTIIAHGTKIGTTWTFNPPHSPHFGGIWEAAVKSAKRHLVNTVGETILTFEELTTFFTRVESILNSRPLCPISSSPEETDYLSPGHFLTGGPIMALPEPSLLDLRDNILSRWQCIKKMTQDFWKRWRMEYLSSLQPKPKWMKANSNNLAIGDLVCLKEPNLPVLSWPVARIIAVHPGKDGVVRVATVKTANTTYKRPVVKFVPLLPLKEPPYNTKI